MRPRIRGRRARGGKEHDRGYKLLFSQPRLVEALVRGFLPRSWSARLDFSTLERAPGSFVSDDLQERHTDLLWRLRWKDVRAGHHLYLLLEFQSTPDPSMPVRLLAYLGLLLQALFRVEPSGKLPLVVPIVIYNGTARWRIPVELAEIFATLPEDASPYLPRFRYVLLDEQSLDLDRPELARNLVAACFRVETCQTPEDFRRRLEEILALLAGTHDEELRRTIIRWLRHNLRRAASKRIIVAGLEDRHMLEEKILEWEAQFLKQGREEGLEEGIEKGLRRGQRTGQIEGIRRVLLKQLQLKFGPLPPSARRTLEAISRKRELERLAGRILKAKSLAELGLG